MALVDHLGLTDYDLAGYSLGGRTALRMLVNGATPKRVVLSGMGRDGRLLKTWVPLPPDGQMVESVALAARSAKAAR